MKPHWLMPSILIMLSASSSLALADHPLKDWVFKKSTALEKKTISWRRQIHQNPELGEQEFETAKLIASHLRGLGLEVHEGLAKTGVVGILRGQPEGPTVALRADMDALPITEKTKVPFASTKKGSHKGREVGVMHACGHDGHSAILMATAELLSELNREKKLNGSVMFIFQPAEEGPSTRIETGEVDWGARQMLKEGLFRKILKPDLIFGLHLGSTWETGTLYYRAGPLLASYDDFFVTIEGKQGHASTPWKSIDPILAGAKVVESLHHIVSRRIDYTEQATVLTVGQFHAGVRENIIPSTAELSGTIRSHNKVERKKAIELTKTTAMASAQAVGAQAKVRIFEGYGVTSNHEKLTAAIEPVLKIASSNKIIKGHAIGGAEDFSYFANEVPGFFFFLGITPKNKLAQAPSNHSDFFFVDEKALVVGVRSLSLLTLEGFEIVRSKQL